MHAQDVKRAGQVIGGSSGEKKRIPEAGGDEYNAVMEHTRFAALARRHGVLLLVQFGSSVSGKTHASSDLDLAVLLERAPESWQAQADLLADLQALFPGKEVDVSLVNRADPLFLRKITEQCRLLYGPAERLHELKIYAFKRYQDHRRFLAMEREYVTRKLRAQVR